MPPGPKHDDEPKQQHGQELPQVGMIDYPFPIRPGLQGRIKLPEDLSVKEARRIAAFISTLAFEDESEPLAIEMRKQDSWEDAE